MVICRKIRLKPLLELYSIIIRGIYTLGGYVPLHTLQVDVDARGAYLLLECIPMSLLYCLKLLA